MALNVSLKNVLVLFIKNNELPYRTSLNLGTADSSGAICCVEKLREI